MATILKPKDGTYVLPAIADPSDLFAYIAEFNGFDYYETDLTGVTPNEIAQNWFFIDRIDTATPIKADGQMKFDGVLFIGTPSNIATDVNASTFDAGQFENIIKQLLNYPFAQEFQNYIACDFQIQLNNLKTLYNSVRYAKATNCSGVEINYSIWI